MKKIIALLLSVLLIIGCMPVTSLAIVTPKVTLVPLIEEAVRAGDAFKVNVVFTAGTSSVDINGYELYIIYDDKAFEPYVVTDEVEAYEPNTTLSGIKNWSCDWSTDIPGLIVLAATGNDDRARTVSAESELLFGSLNFKARNDAETGTFEVKFRSDFTSEPTKQNLVTLKGSSILDGVNYSNITNVSVNGTTPVLDTLSLDKASVTVNGTEGGTITSSAFSTKGTQMNSLVTAWSVAGNKETSGHNDTTSGVSINSSGIITVGAKAVDDTYTVSATSGTVTKTATFIVTRSSSTPTSINITNPGDNYDIYVPLKGAHVNTLTFDSIVYDQYGSEMPSAAVTYEIDKTLIGVSLSGDTMTVTTAAAENTFYENGIYIDVTATVSGTSVTDTQRFKLTRTDSVVNELSFVNGVYGAFNFDTKAATVTVGGLFGSDLTGNITGGFRAKDQYGLEMTTIPSLSYAIYTDSDCTIPYVSENPDITISNDTDGKGELTVSRMAVTGKTYYIKATAGAAEVVLTVHITRQTAAPNTLVISGLADAKVNSTGVPTIVDYDAFMTDQFNSPITASVTWSIKVKDGAIYKTPDSAVATIDSSSGTVTIMAGTPSAEYKIEASSGSATNSYTLNVTRYYDITATSAYGTVTADIDNTTVTSAKLDDTVKLTVTPAAGYEVASVSVYVGTNEITSTLNNGKYSFTMPDADVVVAVTYKREVPTFNAAPAPGAKGYGETNNISVAPAHVLAGTEYSYKWYSCDSAGTQRTELDGTYSGINTAELTTAPKLSAGTHYFICEVTALDNDQDNTTLASDVTYSSVITVNVNKKELVPHVGTVQSKPYDGTTAVTGTPTLTLTGAVQGDEPVATGDFAWTSAKAATDTVNVTNIELVSTGSIDWNTNYTLSTNSLNNAAAGSSIAKASYSGTVTGSKTVYNGASGSSSVVLNLPTPAFTNVVLSNPVVIADNSTFVNNPTVLSSGIGIGFDYDATTDDPNSDIIRVTINSDNYLEFTADLTVTARSIEFTGAHSFDSIKALVQSSVVYGTTNSQVLTGALPTAVSAKVGEKAVTGKFVLKSNPDAMQNAGAPNSASLLIAFVVEEEGISIEEVYPFTVTKKELTPSIATVISKDYDGDTTATGTIALSGAVSGQSPTATATFTWEAADAGTTRVKAENITLGEDYTNNYSLSTESIDFAAAPGGATIKKAALKVTGTTAANKTYDGTIAAAVTLGTVSGIISADVNDVTVTPTGVFVSKTAADNKDVTVTYSLSGNKAANYTAPDAETVKADIAKKQLTATEITAANKTYDGNTNAAVTFTLNGVEAGDTVNVSATGSFNDKTAAGNKDVTVSFTMEEGNYLAPVPATVKADILQRQLIMETPVVTTSKVYDGNATAVVNIKAPLNKVANDELNVTGTASYSSPNAGSSTITVVYQISGKDEANYLKPADYTVNGTVIAKPASQLTFEPISSQPYTGSEIKPAVVKDGAKTLAEGTDYEAEYTNNISVGTASVTLTFKGNYSGKLSKSFAIVGKALTDNDVSVSTISNQTYTGEEIKPEPTVTYNSADLVLGTDYDLSYTNNINAGTATVIVTFKGSYSGTVSKTFTIAQAEPVVTINSSVTLYTGDKLTKLTYTSSTPGTLVFSDTAAGASGDYSWTFTPADTKNYRSVTGKAALTITAVAISKITVGYTQTTTYYTSQDKSGILSSLADKISLAGQNNNGSTATVTKNDVTLSMGTVTAGENTVTVTLTGTSVTAEFKVFITAVTLKAITITNQPNKTQYYEGDTFDDTGMVVTAIYSDNKTKVLSNTEYEIKYTSGGTNVLTKLDDGDKLVTVSYTEGSVTKTAFVPVSVSLAAVSSLSISGTPVTSGYVEGVSFDKGSLIVTAHYQNNDTADVTKLVKVTYYDNNGAATTGNTFVGTSGNTKVRLSYGEAYYDITVTPVDVRVIWAVGTKTPVIETYAYNTVPAYPNTYNPSTEAPEGYVFAGWTDGKTIDSVTNKLQVFTTIPNAVKNVSYTATYNKKVYTVSFVDDNDAIIGTAQTVDYGNSATAPTAPSKPGYTFIGWTSGTTLYKTMPAQKGSDTTVIYKATYEINKYTLKYYNEGNLVYSETVNHGSGKTYTIEPSKPETAAKTFAFAGWADINGNILTLTSIGSDLSVYAKYTETLKKYDYRFLNDDGSVISTASVDYGTVLSDSVKPSAPSKTNPDVKYNYTFTGFAGFKDGYVVTGSVDFKATFSSAIKTYEVSFNVNGTVSKTIYKYGEVPKFTGSTAKPADAQNNYTFSGWNDGVNSYSATDALPAVTSAVTYTAQYTSSQRAATTFNITFKNYDGTVLSEQTVDQGKVPAAPVASRAATTTKTYFFKGWKTGTTVLTTLPAATANAEYTAEFAELDRYYTITFVNYNGAVLSAKSYKGDTAAADISLPQNPQRYDQRYEYTFKGWDSPLEKVTADKTYIAQYDRKDKTFVLTINTKYSDSANTQTRTALVPYGESYALAVPAVTGYTAKVNNSPVNGEVFTTNAITANTTLTIVYSPNSYTLSVEAYKGAELIKGEQLRTAYNSAKTVLIPAVNGYTAYLGGTAIMPQMRYNLSYSNGTWSVDNSAATANTAYAELSITYNATANETITLNYLANQYSITYHIVDSNNTELDSSLYSFLDYGVQTEALASGAYRQYYYTDEVITPPSAERSSDGLVYYVWSGWEGLPYTMPASNLEVYGTFTSGMYHIYYIILDPFGNQLGGNYYQLGTDSLDMIHLGGVGLPFGFFSDWQPYGMQTLDSTSMTLFTQQQVPAKTLTVSFSGATVTGKVNCTVAGITEQKDITDGSVTLTVPFNASYSVTVPQVTGYTPNKQTVSGIMDNVDGKAETVTYTANTHKLTVNYLFEDNTAAENNVIASYSYGQAYTINSPVITGYTPSKNSVTGTMGDEDITETVVYSPKTYTLTINYKYKDGSEAATTVTKELAFGESYSVTSPDLSSSGYTPSQSSVTGKVTAESNITVDVVYTSGEFTIYYSYGETNEIRRYEKGEAVPDFTPEKTGYSFSGWTWSTGAAPDKMPAEDLYATGTYTPNKYKLTVKYVYSGTSTSDVPDDEYEMTFGTSLKVEPKTKSGYTVSPASYDVTMLKEGDTVTFTYTAIPSDGSTPVSAPSDTVKLTGDTVASSKITDALKAKTGEVKIETSTGKVIFTGADAAKIAEGKAELVVKTEAANVSFTAEGLNKLADSVKTSDSLKVEVAKDTAASSGFKVVAGETVLASVEVSVYAGEQKLTKGFGTLTITIPVGKSYAGKTVSILHVKDDGAYTVLTAVVDKDGNAIIAVDSLSSFVAVQKTIKPVAAAYSDINSGDWFEGYAQYVSDQGLMTGLTATTFAPQATASRAMIVTVLWRMAGSPTGNKDAGFKDLTQDWYKEAVNWAYANKITTGKSASEFDPSSPVTREQLASFLYRYSKLKGYDISAGENTNILSYEDALTISEYAMPAMQWAKGAGIINGRTTSTLVPTGQSTRAELAAMLTRYAKTAD